MNNISIKTNSFFNRNCNFVSLVESYYQRTDKSKIKQAVSNELKNKQISFLVLSKLLIENITELYQIKTVKKIIEIVNSSRYGENGYFWINDEKLTMIMDPLKPTLIGKDISKIKDPNGVYLFKEMVKISKNKGEGFVKYLWDKGNFNFQAKLSYIKAFKPWDESLQQIYI